MLACLGRKIERGYIKMANGKYASFIADLRPLGVTDNGDRCFGGNLWEGGRIIGYCVIQGSKAVLTTEDDENHSYDINQMIAGNSVAKHKKAILGMQAQISVIK